MDEDLKEDIDYGLPLANGFVSIIMYSCFPFSPPIPGRHSFLPQLSGLPLPIPTSSALNVNLHPT